MKQQQEPHIIRISECLDKENCPLIYTDIFESVVIQCLDPKHKTNTDVEKVEEEGEVTRPANPTPQPATQARSPLSELNGFKK